MSRLSPILRSAEGNRLMFWCLGCDMAHHVAHGPGSGPRWTWNGDAIKPTFTPSILVRWDQGEPSAADPEIAKKIRRGEIVQRTVKKVCHTFVTAGRIQYLSDCTHALAGQTIDLPEWPAADEP